MYANLRTNFTEHKDASPVKELGPLPSKDVGPPLKDRNKFLRFKQSHIVFGKDTNTFKLRSNSQMIGNYSARDLLTVPRDTKRSNV